MASISARIMNKQNHGLVDLTIWNAMIQHPLAGGLEVPGFRFEFHNLENGGKLFGTVQNSELVPDGGEPIAKISGFTFDLKWGSTYSIEVYRWRYLGILDCIVTVVANRNLPVAAFSSPDYLVFRT